MVPRRRLLGAVGLLVATAGCGTDRQRDRTPTPTVAADPDRAVETGSVSRDDVPPTLRLRGGTDAPPVRRPPSKQRRHRPFDGRDWDVHSWTLDRENADAVRVVPDGRETVEAFLAATDFETETVYVQSMRVLSCYTVTLCSVSWSGDETEIGYGRKLKPYTAACEADTRVYESRLIRIPATVEGVGGSTSLGGSACRGVELREGGGDESDDDESTDGESGDGESGDDEMDSEAATETTTQTEASGR